MGIELCLADVRLPGCNPEAVPLTIKKGSILRLENLDEPPFGGYPYKLKLEADVVGALGHGHRLQVVWRLDDFLLKHALLVEPFSYTKPVGAGRKREYVVKGSWRVSFEIAFEMQAPVGTAE